MREMSCELWEEGTGEIQSETELESPDFASQSPVVIPASRYGPKNIAWRELYSGLSSALIEKQNN